MLALPVGEQTAAAIVTAIVDSLIGDTTLTIATTNSPIQTVVAGTKSVIAYAQNVCKALGIDAKLANRNFAFHSPLIARDVLNQMRDEFASIHLSKGVCDVISNVSGAAMRSITHEYFIQHALSPVNFRSCVDTLVKMDVNMCIEVGPRSILSQFINDTTNSIVPLSSLSTQKTDMFNIMNTLAVLYVNGVNIDWKAVYDSYSFEYIQVPTYPFERKRFWITDNIPDAKSLTKPVSVPMKQLFNVAQKTILTEEISLEKSKYAFLIDHQVIDNVIFPAGGMIYLICEAYLNLLESNVNIRLQNVELITPLILTSAVTIDVILNAKDGAHKVEFTSTGLDGTKVVHMNSTIETYEGTGDVFQLNDTYSDNLKRIYNRLNFNGLQYGKTFQTIQHIHCESKTTYRSMIEIPNASTAFEQATRFYDGILQAAGVPIWIECNAPLTVPFRIKSMTVSKLNNETTKWHCRGTSFSATSNDVRQCSAITIDSNGKFVAEVDNLSVKLLPNRASLEKLLPSINNTNEYECIWSPAPSSGAQDTKFIAVSDQILTFKSVIAQATLTSVSNITSLISANSNTPNLLIVVNSSRTNYGQLTANVNKMILLLQQLRQTKSIKRIVFVILKEDTFSHFICGLTKVAAIELTHIQIKTLIVDKIKDIESAINGTMSTTSPVNYYHSKLLFEQKLLRVQSTSATSNYILQPPQSTGIMVISGGLTGVGFETAKVALEYNHVNGVVLCGRRMPKADILAAINNMRAASDRTIRIAQGDIADYNFTFNLMKHIKVHQPVIACAHSAGVLSDAMLPNIRSTDVDNVFTPKINGALALRSVCIDSTLNSFILYSSIAATLGNPGQAVYAAANSILDGFSNLLLSHGHVSHSVAWGNWADVGMAVSVNESLKQHGFIPLPLRTGRRAVHKLLNNNDIRPQSVVAEVNWDKLVTSLSRVSEMISELSSKTMDSVPKKTTEKPKVETKTTINNIVDNFYSLTTKEKKQKYVENMIEQTLRTALKYSPADFVDKEQGFMDFGLDSLAAVDFRTNLQNLFGTYVSITAADIFDHPNIISLSSFLLSQLQDNIGKHSVTKVAHIETSIAAINESAKLVEAVKENKDNNFIATLRQANTIEKQQKLIQSMIESTLRDILHFTPADFVDTEQGFMDFGLDSLAAVAFRNSLSSKFGEFVNLSASELFDNPNITLLSKFVLNQIRSHPSFTETHDIEVKTVPVHLPLPPTTTKGDIAIISAACHIAQGATTLDKYWAVLNSGLDTMSPIKSDRWDNSLYYDQTMTRPGAYYVDRYGFLSESIRQFDHSFFNMNVAECQFTDPQQRLLLMASWRAFENAQIIPKTLTGSNMAVFVGSMEPEFTFVLRMYKNASNNYHNIGILSGTAAGRLSFFYGVQGPSIHLDTACSSSIVTTKMAYDYLTQRPDTAYALSCGTSLILNVGAAIDRSLLKMVSPDAHCKTFDENANGYSRGEGIGVVLMANLDRITLAKNVRPLAIIKAIDVNQDGASLRLSAPSGTAQESLLKACLKESQLSADTINYIEAHGTGTPLGDPIEVNALRKVYGRDKMSTKQLHIGTSKTSLGHLEGAAGVGALIKIGLMMKHRRVPMHRNFAVLNHEINMQQFGAIIPIEGVDVEDVDSDITATISSFGISGTNAHVIVQEYKEGVREQVDDKMMYIPAIILPISAKTLPSLPLIMERYATTLMEKEDTDIVNFAYTAACHRTHFRHRRAVVGTNISEICEQLKIQKDATSRIAKPQIVFQFTGQGSEYDMMMHELYTHLPYFKKTINECAMIMMEYGMKFELYNSKSSTITHRESLQAELFSVEYALATTLIQLGIEPTAVIGHSFGEYVAATVAGLMTLRDALRIVCLRGRLTFKTIGIGRMIAVAANEDIVKDIIMKTKQDSRCDVNIAVVNTNKRTVVSGDNVSIHQFAQILSALGYEQRLVNKNYAYHSPIVKSVVEDGLQYALNNIQFCDSEIPLISGMNQQRITKLTPNYFCDHMLQPVSYAACILSAVNDGCNVFVEIGPHQVLTTLTNECAGNVVTVPTINRDKSSYTQLLNAIAQLYELGVDINWSWLYDQYSAWPIEIPNYEFHLAEYWPPLVDTSIPWPGLAVALGVQHTGSARLQHELLKMDTANDGSNIWSIKVDLTKKAASYLNDHQIFSSIVCPAAVFIDSSLKLMQHTSKQQDLILTNVELQQPCIFTDNAPTEVGITFINDSIRFKQGNVTYMDGVTKQNDNVVAIDVAKLQLTDVIATDISDTLVSAFYQGMQQNGLLYGAYFRPITNILQYNSAEKTIVTQLKLADDLTTTGYMLHPVLIDGLLQSAAMLLQLSHPADLFLPISMKQIHFNSRNVSLNCIFAQAKITSHIDDVVTFDVVVFDEKHSQVCTITQAAAKRTRRQQFEYIIQQSSPDSKLIYAHEWETVTPTNAGHDTKNIIFMVPKKLASAFDVFWKNSPHNVLVVATDQQIEVPTVPANTNLIYFATKSSFLNTKNIFKLLQICHGNAKIERIIVISLHTDSRIEAMLKCVALEAPKRAYGHIVMNGLKSTSSDLLTAINQSLSHQFGCVILQLNDTNVLRAQILISKAVAKTTIKQNISNIELKSKSGQMLNCFAMCTQKRNLISINKQFDAIGLAYNNENTWNYLHMNYTGNKWTMISQCSAGQCTNVNLLNQMATRYFVGDNKQVYLPKCMFNCHAAFIDEQQSTKLGFICSLMAMQTDTRISDDFSLINDDEFVTITELSHPIEKRQSTVMITGGFGGIGLAIGEQMCTTNKCDSVLLTGRKKPDDAMRKRLSDMSTSETKCSYTQFDTSSHTEITKAIGACHILPTTVYHSAGITESKLIQKIEWQNVENVFTAKVLGSDALKRTLQGYAAKNRVKLVLFSSIASCTGNAGQTHYASANAFMDEMALQNTSSNITISTINWGPWADVGMAANFGEQHWKQSGWRAIKPKHGVQLLNMVENSHRRQSIIADANWNRIVELQPALKSYLHKVIKLNIPKEKPSAVKSPPSKPKLYVKPTLSAVSQNIMVLLRDALRLDTSQVIDPMQGFFDIGLDSLIAEEFKTKLRNVYGEYVTFETTTIFEHSSVQQMSKYVFENLPESDRMPEETKEETEEEEIQLRNVASVVLKSLRDSLQIAASQPIDLEQGFSDMGLDSLLSTTLRNSLATSFTHLSFSPTLLFDYPTPKTLIDYITTELESKMKMHANVVKPLARQIETPLPLINKAIHIIGISSILPAGSNNYSSVWDTLKIGKQAITNASPYRQDLIQIWQKSLQYNEARQIKIGYLDYAIDTFDTSFFRITPVEARVTDPQQRLLLQQTWHAFEHANIKPETLVDTRTGVYMGAFPVVSYTDLLDVSIAEQEKTAYYGSGVDASTIAGRISYVYGLQGPSFTLSTACSTHLVCMNEAYNALTKGDITLALCGTANIIVSPKITSQLIRAKMCCTDRSRMFCKSYDASADGYARGEGVGVMILKAGNLEYGERSLGEIVGIGLNQDGASAGLTAPNGTAQKKLYDHVLTNNNINANDIFYVEGHGSGTDLGDPIETRSILSTFGRDRQKNFMIGTVKTSFGHLEPAASLAGMCRLLLAIRHKHVPQHLHFCCPNPKIQFAESNLKLSIIGENVNTEDTNRLIAINSFGYVGTNAHAVIRPVRQSTVAKVIDLPKGQMLLLSCKDMEMLKGYTNEVATFVQQSPSQLADIAYTMNIRRQQFANRSFIIAETNNSKVSSGDARAVIPAPKIAFVFTGQGSQALGGGRELAMKMPLFNKHYTNIMDKMIKFVPHMKDALYGLDKNYDINETLYAQSTIFCFEYAMAQTWIEMGVKPDVLVGHSLGECVAACVSGALSPDDVCQLVITRATLMQQLPSNTTGMLALSLPSDHFIIDMLTDSTRCPWSLDVAGVNHTKQTTVSGPLADLAAIQRMLVEMGYVCTSVPVSHGFHSRHMSPIIPKLKEIDATITYHSPKIPIVSNLTGKLQSVFDSDYFCEQILSPVLFVPCVDTLLNELGVNIFVEVGPRPVLTNLIRQCKLTPQQSQSLVTIASRGSKGVNGDEWIQFLYAAGQLWSCGVEFDLSTITPKGNHVDIPSYPFNMTKHWITQTEEYINEVNNNMKPVQAIHHKLTWGNDSKPIINSMIGQQWLLVSQYEDIGKSMQHHFKQANINVHVPTVKNISEYINVNMLAHLTTLKCTGILLVLPSINKQSCTWTREFTATQKLALHLAKVIQKANQPIDIKVLVNISDNATTGVISIYRALIQEKIGKNIEILLLTDNGHFKSLLKPDMGDAKSESGVKLINVNGDVQSSKLAHINERLPENYSINISKIGHTSARITINDDVEVGTNVQDVRIETAMLKELPDSTELTFAFCGTLANEEKKVYGIHKGKLQSTITISKNSIKQLPKYLSTVAACAMILSGNDVEHITDIIQTTTVISIDVSSPIIVDWKSNVHLLLTLPQSNIVSTRGTVLITGGVGGIGSGLAEWYASHTGVRELIVTSRKTPPSDSLRQVCGDKVKLRTVHCDVADSKAMHKALQASQYTITSIIHAAGIQKSALVSKQTWALAENVMAPKIIGGHYLHEYSRQHSVDTFILFSSIASVFGVAGETAYCAANGYLDDLAHMRQNGGLPAVSLNLGPWAEVGMAVSLTEQHEKFGLRPLAPERGNRAIVDAMCMGFKQLCIVDIDEQVFGKEPNLAQTRETVAPAVQITAKKGVPISRSKILADLENAIKQVTNITDRILPNEGFMSIGVDSFVAVELRNKIVQMFPDITLPTTVVFDYPTLNSLTDFIVKQQTVDVPDIAIMPVIARSQVIADLEDAIKKVTNITERILPNEGFMSIGIDSFVAVELRNKIAQMFPEINLPTTVVFDYPTLNSLTDFIMSQLNVTESSIAPALSLKQSHIDDSKLAIIGISCAFPHSGSTVNQYWELLLTGTSGTSVIPPKRWNYLDHYTPTIDTPGKMYINTGGFVDINVYDYDAQFFGISGREAKYLDPQQRLLMEHTVHALHNAHMSHTSVIGTNTGVYVGAMSHNYADLLNEQLALTKLNIYTMTGTSSSVLAGRLAYTLGMEGPTISIDTACSSSLMALYTAVNSYDHTRPQSYSVVAGVDIMLDPRPMIALCQAHMLSPDGLSMTFDQDANGYARAEGCGVMIVTTMQNAIHTNANIYAIVNSCVSNQDGMSSSLTAPRGASQQRLLQDALDKAQFNVNDIAMFECHGTGTSLGDPIEMNAIASIYSNGKRNSLLPIVAVKASIGHLEAAAGVASLFKIFHQLKYGTLHQQLHFKLVNQHFNAKDSVQVVPVIGARLDNSAANSSAAISSFGFSGTNCHAIITAVEQHVDKTRNINVNIKGTFAELLTMSTTVANNLDEVRKGYLNYFTSSLSDWRSSCRSLTMDRTHMKYRKAIRANTRSDLLKQLETNLEAPSTTVDVFNVYFLYPGQGSQYHHMAKELYHANDKFQFWINKCHECFALCDVTINIMDILFGENLQNVSNLDTTFYSQIALFTVDYSLAQMWMAYGITATCSLGHSLGELVAACIGGVFTLEDACRLVAHRARLMNVLPHGMSTMIAVHLHASQVQRVLDALKSDDVVVAAQTRTQTTLSTSIVLGKLLIMLFNKLGYDSTQLHVSHGFHSKYVQPMIEDFRQIAQSIQYNRSSIPIVSNIDGNKRFEFDANYWCQQILSPVNFEACVKTIIESTKSAVFIHCGPRSLLLNMISDSMTTQQRLQCLFLPSLTNSKSDVDTIGNSIVQLYDHGADLEWAKIIQKPKHRVDLLPQYPFVKREYNLFEKGNTEDLRVKSVVAETKKNIVYMPAWIEQAIAQGNRNTSDKLFVIGLESANIEEILQAAKLAAIQGHRQLIAVDDSHQEAVNINSDNSITDVARVVKQLAPSVVVVCLQHVTDVYLQTKVLLWAAKVCHAADIAAEFAVLTQNNMAVMTNEVNITVDIVAGFTKTLSLECSRLNVVHIDVDETTELKTMIREIANAQLGSCAHSIALRGSKRYIQRLMHDDETELLYGISKQYKPQSAIITGAFGGIGMHVAQHIHDNGCNDIVLCGRTMHSSTTAPITRMRKNGSNIRSACVDVSCATDMYNLMKHVNVRARSTCSIIHTAGTVNNAVLKDITYGHFMNVYAPKITGTKLLHELSKQIKTPCFVQFSSIASAMGSAGQLNYASANAFIDGCHSLRLSAGHSCQTINWGPWADVGMLAKAPAEMRIVEQLKRKGWYPIDSRDGLEVIDKIMLSPHKQQIVFDAKLSTIAKNHPPLADWLSNLVTVEHDVTPQITIIEDNASTLSTMQRSSRAQIESFLRQLLELPSSDAIDEEQGFMSMGMDSLMITELRNKLDEAYGRQVEISASIAFNCPNLKSLVDYIDTNLFGTKNMQQAHKQLTMTHQINDNQIAIIAMCGAFSDNYNVDQLWTCALEGRECVRYLDNETLKSMGVDETVLKNPLYVPASGRLDGIEEFDNAFFKLTARDAAVLDPQIRKFSEMCYNCLELSGYVRQRKQLQIGVFAGAEVADYMGGGNIDANETYGSLNNQFLLNQQDFLTTWTGYLLGLEGPAVTVYTACSTSIVAVVQACHNLANNSSALALAGGSSLVMPHQHGYIYQEGMMFSPDGHCRPFDVNSNGIIRGSGLGVVALKRLSDAQRDGDIIHAVLSGYATSNDGDKKASFTAPSQSGQVHCIIDAQRMAGIDASQLQYIETHGTATKLGDAIEIQALQQVFNTNSNIERTSKCLIGSIKANIGHAFAASGIAGLIKICKMIQHRTIPPQINFTAPHPNLNLERTPFQVCENTVQWMDQVKASGISSFGVGGTNAHLVVTMNDNLFVNENEVTDAQNTCHTLLITGQSAECCVANAKALANHLSVHPDTSITNVAYTLLHKRDHFKHRLTVVANDVSVAMMKLHSVKAPTEVLSTQLTHDNIAFVYSPQGVQYPGIAKCLYGVAPVFTEEFDKCCRIISDNTGVDFKRIVHPDENDMNKMLVYRTDWTQPVVFTIGYAIARQMNAWGIQSNTCMGHSLGEYIAATMAGVFSLEEIIPIVMQRGQLMNKTDKARMVVINNENVDKFVSDKIAITAVITPNLKVLAGRKEDVNNLTAQLDEMEVEYNNVYATHAFHSYLMKPILNKFNDALSMLKINNTTKRIASNVCGNYMLNSTMKDIAYWTQHILEPVQYGKCIDTMSSDVAVFVEIGPSGFLSTFAKVRNCPLNIIKTVLPPKLVVNGQEDFELYGAVGQLWQYGLNVDWNVIQPISGRQVCIPTYQFNKTRCWVDQVELKKQKNIAKQDTEMNYFVTGWQRKHLPIEFKQETQKWLIFMDDCGVGDALIKTISDNTYTIVKHNVHQIEKLTVDTNNIITINPCYIEAYESLYSHLSTNNCLPTAIYHGWTLTSNKMKCFTSVEDVSCHQLIGIHSINGLHQNLLPYLDSANIIVLTNWLSEMPEKSTINGALRVIVQEVAKIKTYCIDIMDNYKPTKVDHLIDIVHGLTSTTNCIQTVSELSLYQIDKAGVLYEQIYSPADMTTTCVRVSVGDVILITGGTSTVALAHIRAIVDQVGGCTFILANRSGQLPKSNEGDKVKNRIDAFINAGCRVEIVKIDVVNERAVDAAIRAIVKQYGRIDGIIHAAGVPTIHKLQKSVDDIEQVIAPKVYG